MPITYTNNATSTLASGISSGALSLTVQAGHGARFPTLGASRYFFCTLANVAGVVEIVQVTARTGDTFTIVRGQDNTTAVAWLTGDKAELRIVASALDNMPKLDEANVFTAAQSVPAGATGAQVPQAQEVVGKTGAQTMAGPLTVQGNVSMTSLNGGPLAGMRNFLINGDMRIAQRATSFAMTDTTGVPDVGSSQLGYYTMDRLLTYGSGASVTVSQVTVGDGKRASFAGAASVTAIGAGQRIEAANAASLAGKSCTFSCKLSNSLLTTVTWTANYANTADTFGTISMPSKTLIATGTFTVSASEATYSTTIAVPSAASTGIELLLTVGAQTSGTFTVGDMQFEVGTVATPLEVRSYATELALCQRYFFAFGGGSGITTSEVLLGVSTSASAAIFTVPSPVPRLRSWAVVVASNFSGGALDCLRTATQGTTFSGPATIAVGRLNLTLSSNWGGATPTMVAGDTVIWYLGTTLLRIQTEI